MSDIYTDIYTDDRPGSRQQSIRTITGPDILREEYAKANELKTQIETKRIATQTPDFFLPGLTERDYARIYDFVDSGQITTNNAELQLIAESIAKQKNLDVDDVINNFDVFLSQMGVDPAKKNSTGFFQGVANEFRAAQIQSQVDRLWREYRNAMDNDNPDLADGLKKDINALSLEASRFRDTYTPEGHGVFGTLLAAVQKGALYASGSSVYMAQIMFGSLAAGGVGGFYMGWEANRDKEYGRQIEAGVKHDYAKVSSNIVAVGQSTVEMLLGRGIGKVAGTITGSNIATDLVGKWSGDVVKKIGLTGAPYVMGKFLLGTLGEAVGEGTEEVIQYFMGNLGVLASKGFQMADLEKALQDPDSPESKALWEDVRYAALEQELGKMSNAAALELKAQLLNVNVEAGKAFDVREAAGEFMGGFLSALVLDSPNIVIGGLRSIKQVRDINGMARGIPSAEQFKKEYKEAQEKSEGGLPEISDAALDNIHQEQRRQRDREEAKLAAEIKAQGSQLEGLQERKVNDAGEDETPALYRNPDGSLYTRIEDEKREGNVVTGSYRGGDGSKKTESNTYWNIDYRIENGVLDITGVNIAGHRKAEFAEFFQQFAQQFADTDIRWNPETEENIALRDSLVQNNRRGPDAELNYFENTETAVDESYRIRLDKQLQEHTRLDADEREAWIQLWEAAGEKNGLGLQGTFDRVYADPESIFSDTLEDTQAAQAKGAEIKGATFWRETGKSLKAVMYVAKNGDFSTLSHESIHAYRTALKGIDPGLSAEIDQVLNKNVKRESWMSAGEYRRAQEEYLADSFEDYLYNGVAPEPALKSLFDQIAAFMRRIYRHFKQGISPEIQKVFDQIFSGYDSRAENTKTAQEGPQGRETGKETANAPEGPRRAASTLPEGISEAYNDEEYAEQIRQQEAFYRESLDEQVRRINEESTQKAREIANKRLNEERPLLDKNNARGDPKPTQPSNNLDEVYRLVEESRAEFDSYVEALRDKYGGEIVSRRELKARDRASRKITPYAGAEEILDINGKTLVLDDIGAIVAVMEDLRGRDEVVRIKDRYKNPGPWHYRDALTNIRMSNGAIVELQLNTQQMMAAKEDFGGHTLYEAKEQIETATLSKKLDYTLGKNADGILKNAMEKLYDAAFEDVLTGAMAKASSLDITELLKPISVHFQESGALSNVLSEKTIQKLGNLYARALSSQSRNISSGSSKSGTNIAVLTTGRESNASLDDVGGVSVTSVPSSNSIAGNEENVKGNVDNSGVPAIREKYQAAKKTEGWEDTKNIGGREIEGRWVLTEAETPTASHDETTFNETQSFPTSQGTSINDRDYRNDKAAQEAVVKMAGEYDGRALEGIVITDDGIVISGNNRTMSGKRAAREGTDGKYIAALEKKAKKYGFTAEQVREYQHPRLVFEVAANGEYSTELFAQFNQSTRKAQSPMETAVKMAKRLAEKPEVIRNISAAINEHDTLSELYNDKKAVQEIFNTLQKDGLIGEYERPQYVDEQGQITGAGEDLLESVMLGSVLDEGNIRGLQGTRAMRQKLVRGITALVENKAMGNYSFVPEMNEAVGIALAVNNTVGKDGKRTYGTVQDYVKQQILPGMPDGLSVEKRASVQLAEALESGGQKDFALWYGGLNASLAEAAKGQSELFTGSVESKESILDRYVGFREDLDQRKAANQKTLTDPAAGTAAKARAALDDAGIARAEADGSLFQLGGNPVETLINRAGSMLDDLGERETVVKELRELERLYPPESNQYLAPNGKASLLIEALGEEHGQQAWYAVRTDSFKKWFGDWENDPENASKVVDENGEPKPIFHGTNAELFDIFKHKYTAHDTGFFGKGFYFATHQGEARFYGKNIYSVFLNIKKPFDFYKELYGPDNRIATTAYGATPAFWKNLIRLFPEYGDEKVSIAGDYITDDEGNIDYSERKQEEITWREMISRIDDLASQLKAYPYEDAGRGEKYTRYAAGDYGTKGWDRTSTFIRDEWLKPETEKWNAAANIIHDESLPDWSMPKIFLQDHAAEFSQKIMALGYDGINAEDEIIGFNSTQIKSATDNAGTYSGENPSILFQTYDELLEDAARYESAEDFEAAYRNTETRPDDAYISTEADRRWYEIFWRDARIAAGLTEETTPAAPEQADRAFLKDINRDKLQDILTTLDGKLHDRQKEPLAPEAGEDRAPYDKELAEYQKAQNLKARINRELPHMGAWVGIAAKVANGEELSSGDYNTLRGYLRQAPRDYRALFADLTGRREWGLNLTEMQDGVPNTRLSAPRLERSDDMDAKNRQRLADAIGDADPELSQGIREGTITMDDPRIAAFEKGLTAGIKKREEAAAATEAAADEDARKFKGTIQGQALNLYREFKEAEEKHQAQTTELAQKIRRGKELTSREREETTRLLTDSDAAHAAFEDFAAANNLRAEVREELARIDARYAERQRLRELQKKRNVVREVKRIKKGLITNIFRRVNYKNITYREGLTIRIIQRYVEPLLVRAGIRQWVGTGLDDRSLKEMYYEMKTNADFLDKLLKKVGYERAVQIEKLLETKWDFFTGQDKAALIRALPKHDWVEDLNIEGLKADEEENSIQIEIKKVDGKEVLGEEEQRIAREALGDELFTRIGNQALAEWTLVEMAELAEAVNDLYAEGRENFRIRQEVQYTAREKLRNDILATIKKAGIEINDDDSPEEKKRKLAKRAKLLNKFVSRDVKNKPYWDDFKTADTRRFTTEMDGGRKGAFTNQMYWAENDAYNQEESEKRRRYEAMIKILEANHINLEELFKKVEIPGLSVPGKDLDMTVDRLLYYRRGSKNDFTRQALLYGVLTSADERRELKRYRNVLAAQDSFADAAEARLKLILDYQEAFFNREENKKFLALEEAAGKDWDENGDRLNQFMISEYNRPMRREDNYVTMHRLGPNGEATDYDIIDDLTAGAGAGLSWVNKGFAEHRQHILPWNQTPIDTSFYGVWVKSVEASEHLMAYGHFVRNLHAVFKSGDSGAILENLRNHWGQPAIDWINGFIDEKARPDAGITRASGLMRIMRGKTATAYLAGRTSSILKQKVTSPWPYLQEGLRPDMYIAACLECAEGFGKVNDFIRGKSNYMRTRDADMMLKLIREAQAMTNTPWGRRIDKVNNFLMKGLTWADWSSVAPGWLVKYRTELTRLTAERDAEYQSNLAKYHEAKYAELYKTEEAITQKALEETRSIADVDYEAVAMADDMVRRLQPSSRNTDQASMFKQNNEFVNALLQFQNALGTIYKNFRYDIPQYVREGQVMKIVGMVTGYAMAGICVVALVDWPFDDDDEKEKDGYLARWAIFNSLTQLSDSVPFIGSEIVTPNLEWVIRGKRSYQGNSSIYPVAKKAFESTAGIATLLWEDDPEKRGEKFRKAATAFGEAVSIYNGIPVSGIEELGRAAGIGDGDGELEFYPQALLGQRKRKK